MNQQRDAVVQKLSDQFAADRISIEELERRLDLVYQAQSPADLAALTADLPALVAPASPGRPLSSRAPAARRFSAFLSNIERSGAIDVPARLDVRATFGNVELDLSDATFGALTEIHVRSTFGNVEITLPSGVRVENDGGGILGSFECHIAPGMMPMVGTAPVVRITGRAILANVEINADPMTDPMRGLPNSQSALPHP